MRTFSIPVTLRVNRAYISGRRVLVGQQIPHSVINSRCKKLQRDYIAYCRFDLDYLKLTKNQLHLNLKATSPFSVSRYSEIADDIYLIDIIIKSKHYRK